MTRARVIRGERTAQAKPFLWGHALPQPDSGGQFAGERPDVESLLLQAQRKAFAEGESAGERRCEALLQEECARLGRAITELAGMRDRCRHDAEEDTVKLALAIAARILHREIAADPEALLGLVKAALARMSAREIHCVRVHPDLAPRIAPHVHGVEVRPDRTLESGDVLFETARGSFDASIATQLKEIERGFLDLLQRRR